MKFLYIFFLLFVSLKTNAQSYQELMAEANKYGNNASEQALRYARLASIQAQKEFGTSSKEYGGSLNLIGELLKKKEQYKESEQYLLKAHSVFSDSLKVNCEEYGANLMSLGKFFHQTNRYDKAYFWFKQFIDFSDKYGTQCQGAYAFVGDFYSSIGDYKKAKFYLEKNVKDCAFLEQKAPLEYAYRVERLADFYANMGNYLATERLYQKCYPIFQKQIPVGHPEWAYIQSKYLSFLINLKNYKKAEKVIGELFQIPYTKSSVEILQNIATAYWRMNRLREAETFFSYCVNLRIQQSENGKCTDYQLLTQLGALYAEQKDFEKADDYLLSAEKIAEQEGLQERIKTSKASEEEKDIYIDILLHTGCLYAKQKNYEKAIPYFQKAKKTIDLLSKVNDERQREVIHQLIVANSVTGNYKALFPLLEKDIYKAMTEQKNRVLPVVGTRLRELFLEKIERYNQSTASIVAASSKNIERSGELIYDYALLNKTVALQWNLSDLTSSRKSQDSSVIINFKAWQNVKQKLGFAQIKEADNEPLRDELEEIESKLTQQLSLSEDYFQEVNWRDVQAKLAPNELSIEFLSMPDFDVENNLISNDTLYYAVILGYNSTSPDVVKLFKQSELKSLLANGDDFYFDQQSYELVWKQIEPFTTNIATLYYAATGLFHTISLPALTAYDGKKLIEKHQFQTLLSTRDLALKDRKNEVLRKGEVLIFAGMNYEQFSEETNFQATFSNDNINEDSLFRLDMMRGKEERYPTLPFTKIEGEKVQKTSNDNGFSTRFFYDVYATEKNIKLLTNQKKSPNVLIVSTHGFYNPKDAASENPFSWNSEPLMRCGLVMAGANKSIHENKIFGSSNDGIWTGYEIEESNLSNTQLVILSACETGNGELSNNEGIFGLQRAFKLAGADYVLMCMNKIHDQIASEFVTHFYEKIAKGEPIQNAFYETQVFFKNKYPDSLDWANWVLIR